jgi:hypothetical protein
MTDADLLDKVGELRNDGHTPKDIARALGLRPGEVAPLVRAVASERGGAGVETDGQLLVGCWVNQGWSTRLTVAGHPDWPIGTPSAVGFGGLATAVVARAARSGGRASVCTMLVDSFCLGVKDAIPPRKLAGEKLAPFLRQSFGAYDRPPIEAPLELVQDLVYGAVEYARGLGFRPHPDFQACRAHLGERTGPSAITFGEDGKPLYISGPYDDANRVVRPLERSVGQGNYHFIVCVA